VPLIAIIAQIGGIHSLLLWILTNVTIYAQFSLNNYLLRNLYSRDKGFTEDTVKRTKSSAANDALKYEKILQKTARDRKPHSLTFLEAAEK